MSKLNNMLRNTSRAVKIGEAMIVSIIFENARRNPSTHCSAMILLNRR